MTTNLKTTPEVQTLIKAKELLEEEGWTQGTFRDEDGYCLIGALNVARNRSCVADLPRRLQSLLLRAIWDDRPAGYHWTDVFDWNDTHTKEEVLAALDKAIALGLGVP